MTMPKYYRSCGSNVTIGKTVANELYKRGARTIEDLTTKEFGLNPAQKVCPALFAFHSVYGVLKQ